MLKRLRSAEYRAKQGDWSMRPDVRDARLARQRVYATSPEKRTAMRVRTLKHAYGLTAAGYLALVHFQDYKCAICKTDLLTTKAWVDHNHDTGTVRGALCPRCNTTAGATTEHADYLRKVVAYIEAH